MSILAPWLALILVIAFVSYHRFSLAVFAAIGGSALVACALLGASSVSVIAAAVVLALIVLPLLITPIRQRFITAPLLGFYSKILPPLSD
ncbi:MAG: acyl-CoA dehydrogenase, partial [Arenimonas sp.]